MLKYFKWIAFIATFAAATCSHAVTVLDVSDGSARFGAGYTGVDFNTTFAEQYSFTVGAGFNINGGIISVMSDNRLGLDLTGLTLTSGASTINGSAFSVNPNVWTLSADHLLAGTYLLTVLGKVVGTQGGSFAGTIDVASAVPEAETYLLLLIGLGVIVVAARRRRTTLSLPQASFA